MLHMLGENLNATYDQRKLLNVSANEKMFLLFIFSLR